MFPIEAFRNTLDQAIKIFERQAIRYHLTGGVTGVAWGQPRLTQDIDIVIDQKAIAAHLDLVLQEFAYGGYLKDDSAIRKAISSGTMFQLLDISESLKLDIYPRELVPGELDRSVSLPLFADRNFFVASRVDAAVSKLIWISKGSHKSRADLRHIVRGASMDERRHIIHLAGHFDLTALLDQVLSESDEISY